MLGVSQSDRYLRGKNQTNLFAVDDLLLEDSVVVPDAVAVGRHRQRGHRVQEAGGQSTEAPVPEAGVSLHVLELLDVQAELKLVMHELVLKQGKRRGRQTLTG